MNIKEGGNTMPKPITKAIYDTYNRLSAALGHLDAKMEVEGAASEFLDEAWTKLLQTENAFIKNLGYNTHDEFLEAIWEYEREHPD